MKKLFGAGIAVAMLAFSSLQAYSCCECYEGWYGQVFAGANWAADSDLENVGTGTGELEFDTGWGVGGALGYQWCCGLALEGEVSYRANDIEHGIFGGTSNDATGDQSIWAFMVNGYYRVPMDCGFTPYVGVGIGAAIVDLDSNEPAQLVVDDSDTVFAYQGIVGVSYCFCDSWDFFVEYRYLGTTDPDYMEGSTEFKHESANHFLGAGFRFPLDFCCE